MSRWSSRSIANRFQHWIFYVLIRFCGVGPAYVLLFFVAVYYALKPATRRRSAPYLSRRYPNDGTLLRLWRTFRLNFSFGQVLVDRAAMGILGRGGFEAAEADKKLVRRLLERGRGVILMTAHVGSWQSAMGALDFVDCPKSVVLMRGEGDVDRHYFEHGDGEAPVRFIDPNAELGGTLEMLQCLQRGEVLCVMGDRLFGTDWNGVGVDFLGGAVRVPMGAYRLASLTGAPIAVIFTRRTGPTLCRIGVERIIEVPGNVGRRPEAYRPYARLFAAALERFVEKQSYQFFNYYDLWKEEE